MSYIYQTVNSSQFHTAFHNADRKEQFTYQGLNALFERLESLAEDTGEPMELDVIAICCDYCEYSDLDEYNQAYGTEHTSWEDVAEETTVILVGVDGAITQNH